MLRVRDKDDDSIAWHSSRQIDARQLVFALRRLLTAERLEQAAPKAPVVHPIVGHELAEARNRFEDALPGVEDLRWLMHFDEWSRGTDWDRRKSGVRPVKPCATRRASSGDSVTIRAPTLFRSVPTPSTELAFDGGAR